MSEKTKSSNLKVEGLSMFARVHEPHTGFKGKGEMWSMELLVDEKNAKLLQDAGKDVARTGKIGGPEKVYPEHPGLKVFKLKKNTTNAKGSASQPPTVVDSELTPIPSETIRGSCRFKAAEQIEIPFSFH